MLMSSGVSGRHKGSASFRVRIVTTIVVVAAALFFLGGGVASASTLNGPSVRFTADRAFGLPYDGALRYEKCAPQRLTKTKLQLNQPLGAVLADKVARCLDLDKSLVFTSKQYREFITGGGNGGDKSEAETMDASVKILTNTIGNPYFVKNSRGRVEPVVLASYGLYVQRVVKDTPDSTPYKITPLLMSPANASAPPLKFNQEIGPDGYFAKWCHRNGATKSLKMLRRSAYTSEVAWSLKAQHETGVDELATFPKTGEMVGMSMVPALWNINFTLIYTLNPKLAAKMPGFWAPIPTAVASAIVASPNGQVLYSDYAKYLQAGVK
jgi:hypothetical protein